MRDELLRRLRELQIITKGDFTLRSGEKSDLYINMRKAYGDPGILESIAEIIGKRLDKSTTCVAGCGDGGVPLATAIALRYSLKLILIRDKHKCYGLSGLIDGYVPNREDGVACVDDLITEGTTLRDILEAIRPTGARIVGHYVVVKRRECELEVPLDYIFTMEELLN